MSNDRKNIKFFEGGSGGGLSFKKVTPQHASPKKLFYLRQLGCAKNLVEGEHISGLLMAAGWLPVAEPAEADALIVNTCGFIRPAVEESLAAIMELAEDKRKDQRLVVVGCLVSRYGKKLAAELEEADQLISPGDVPRLVELLEEPAIEGAGRLVIRPARSIFGADSPRAISTGPGWAYLRLSDGCAHRCGFCTIPAIRGRLRSRTMDDVLAEAAELAEAGVKELNLVAQDLTAYASDLGIECGIAALLPKLAAINGIKWIRLLYLHPDSADDALLDTMAKTRKVLPYFDLPVQHISDPVLSAMRRSKSGAQVRSLVARVRELIPGATLRTTVMTGHPGEGETEFAELMEFVEETQFDHLGCFPYEPEPGTRSAKLDRPPAKVARARAKNIMALQNKISRARLKEIKGKELECLVLGPHPDSDMVWQGRLPSQAPEVDGEVIITEGSAEPGEITLCRVTKTHAYDVEAMLL
jgi:ribosomal protein S12 methylthiotransferase